MFCEHRAVLPADGHRDRVWAWVQEEGKHTERLAISSITCLSTTETDKPRDKKELKAQREVLLLLPRRRKSHDKDCDVITRDGLTYQYTETGEVTAMTDYQNKLIE